MRLTSIMCEDLVVPSLQANAKEAVLEELVDRLVTVQPSIDRAHALRVLLEREGLGSTAVGHGLAIPHAKLPELDTLVACFARSVDGVDFQSLDGQPAHLFLALLAPEGAAGLHLKALARASRLFKRADLRERLMSEPTRRGLWNLIIAADESLTQDSASRA